MATEKHVADSESEFFVLNLTPDFCRVGNSVVAFDIAQKLSSEMNSYADSVYVNSEKVLLVDSVIKGVLGNAGVGVASGVSQAAGHSKVLQGASTVIIEGRMAGRHGDIVDMNGKVD